jgi:hypothetical protein
MATLRGVASRAAAIMLLISATAVEMTVSAPSAFAAGTVLFNQSFHGNTVDGPAGRCRCPPHPPGPTPPAFPLLATQPPTHWPASASDLARWARAREPCGFLRLAGGGREIGGFGGSGGSATRRRSGRE